MRTTLWLDDELHRQAKARATECGLSLTMFVEEALRDFLERPTQRRRRICLPVSTSTGGLLPEFSTLEEATEAADLVGSEEPASA